MLLVADALRQKLQTLLDEALVMCVQDQGSGDFKEI